MKKTTIILITFMTLSHISFAQKIGNSKIVDFLNNSLKQSMYFRPIDSISDGFKNKAISRESSINLENDPRRNFRYSDNKKTFEDLITVISKDFKFFNKFIPDTVLFYFNNQKLNKCCLNFKLNKIQIDEFNKLLTQKFGTSGYSSFSGWGGPYWTDNYAKLNTFYNDRDLNGVFNLEFEFFEPKEVLESTLTKNQILEKQIKTNREGNGIGLFSLSLSKLENIIKLKMNMKTLEEKQFSAWRTYGFENKLGYEYDEKTKDHTIPLFQLLYEDFSKGKSSIYKIETVNSLNNPIKYFEVTSTINGLQLAEFKKSLMSNNYLLNENLSGIFQKQTYQNKTKKLMVTIKKNANSTYSIGIR